MRRTTCHTRRSGERTDLQQMRAAGVAADVPMVLAQAMLISLSQDLGRRLQDKMWQADPNEMLLHDGVTADDLLLVKELNGPCAQVLYSVVAAGSAGRVPTGRGTVLRMARRYARTMNRWVRTSQDRKEAA